MGTDEDIEEYLAYFEMVYDGVIVQDNQRIVKLVSKLSRH